MTTPGPSIGWKTRRDKAAAKNVTTDERAAIRAERQRMAQELIDASNAAAAENAKLQARARCSCPVCDGAPIDVELAARVITAMQRLPAHVVNDPAVVAALQAVVAAGRELDRGMIYGEAHRGLHVPHRVYAAADVTPKAEPIVSNKGKRKPSIVALAAAQDDDA